MPTLLLLALLHADPAALPASPVSLGSGMLTPTQPSTLASIAQAINGPLVDLVEGVLLALLALAARWTHVNAQDSKLKQAMAFVVSYVTNASKHLVEGLAPEIKAALANDGVIDTGERAALIAKGVALTKAELPAWVQTILNSGFGAGITTFLSGAFATELDKHLDAAAPGDAGVTVEHPTPAAGTPTPKLA